MSSSNAASSRPKGITIHPLPASTTQLHAIYKTDNTNIETIQDHNHATIQLPSGYSPYTFQSPHAICIDSNNDIVMLDGEQESMNILCIKRMKQTTNENDEDTIHLFGEVSIIAKLPSGLYSSLQVTRAGDVLTFDLTTSTLMIVSRKGVCSAVKYGLSKSTTGPFAHRVVSSCPSLTILEDGDIVICDSDRHCLKRFHYYSSAVEILVGWSGESSCYDGPIEIAGFTSPQCAILDQQGDLIIADTGNHRIRKVEMANKIVSTIAGNPFSIATAGHSDDTPLSSLFSSPISCSLDQSGNLFILDSGNSCLRCLTTSHELFTLVNEYDWTQMIQLDSSRHVVCDSEGSLLVLDDSKSCIIEISVLWDRWKYEKAANRKPHTVVLSPPTPTRNVITPVQSPQNKQQQQILQQQQQPVEPFIIEPSHSHHNSHEHIRSPSHNSLPPLQNSRNPSITNLPYDLSNSADTYLPSFDLPATPQKHQQLPPLQINSPTNLSYNQQQQALLSPSSQRQLTTLLQMHSLHPSSLPSLQQICIDLNISDKHYQTLVQHEIDTLALYALEKEDLTRLLPLGPARVLWLWIEGTREAFG